MPNVTPWSPPSRLATNASATGPGECRTSSAACRVRASRSTSRGRPTARPGRGRARRPPRSRRSRRRAPRSWPRAEGQLLAQRRQRCRLAGQGAHDVEGVDVARALPDRVERRLAVEPRQAVLLDVAVAAEALQRLGDHRRGALADPELAQRDAQARRGRPRRRRRRGRAASRARSPPRTRGPGRRARCASAAGRRAAPRTRCGAARGAPPARARPASWPSSRARSRAGSRRPSR